MRFARIPPTTVAIRSGWSQSSTGRPPTGSHLRCWRALSELPLTHEFIASPVPAWTSSISAGSSSSSRTPPLPHQAPDTGRSLNICARRAMHAAIWRRMPGSRHWPSNPVVNGLRRTEITLAFRDSLGGRHSNPVRGGTLSRAHSERPRPSTPSAQSADISSRARQPSFSYRLLLAESEPHVAEGFSVMRSRRPLLPGKVPN
jgi:hypothetical protein